MRNKLQIAKEENTKLNILIKREIGESIDIDKALKDKVYWKGRAELIESLKTKIKILESQVESLNKINNNNYNSNSMNNSSNNLNINNTILSNSNNESILPGEEKKNINGHLKISSIPNPSYLSYSDYKKEKESFKQEIERLKEENAKVAYEYSRVKIRINVLEKELRTQKDDLTSKIKILIEKSDNDEKLILALNKELEKRGRGINPSALGYENPVFNLQQEINKLRIEIKEKDSFINNINAMISGNNNNSEKSSGNDAQWNMQTLSKIITRLKELEDENKKLKVNSDDGKIYESLARDNAKLRLRIKDLEEKLTELRG